jgi:hypothetical protein
LIHTELGPCRRAILFAIFAHNGGCVRVFTCRSLVAFRNWFGIVLATMVALKKCEDLY